jgi:hypothetical protein
LLVAARHAASGGGQLTRSASPGPSGVGTHSSK